MLAYYVHDLNPIITKIWWFTPRWYGLAYLLGFLFAYWLILRLARQGMLRMPIERAPDLVLNCCIFGVLVGGRMGYVIFYDLPAALADHTTPLLWKFTAKFPFWGALEVWNGGMSAHGGVIFTVITLLIFARRNKYSLANIGDAACMVVPLGLFFGRIANFINGELYGHPASVPWAVKFPIELVNRTKNDMDLSEPARQAQSDAVSTVIAQTNERFNDLHITGPEGLLHQLQSGTSEVSTYISGKLAVMSELPARHPSQLYEALLEGALLFAICWVIGKKWKKDGMASGAFLTFYPVMRIIGEQFRVGDDPRTIAGVTLSLGVWYSLLMFVPGLVYWLYWIKRDRAAVWTPQTGKAGKPAAKSGG